MEDVDAKLKTYSKEELKRLFDAAPYTHVRLYTTELFQKEVNQYLPPSFIQLYEAAVFRVLTDFTREVAMTPNAPIEYQPAMLAVFQGFFKIAEDYEEELGEHIYGMMYSLFASRLVTNAYTVNEKDDDDKPARRFTLVIDLLPLEAYDQVERFNEFQLLRQSHEWNLNTIH